MASSRRRGERHHYDSVSSDTEYSEPEEHRKGCIKRSKYVHCTALSVSAVKMLFYCCIINLITANIMHIGLNRYFISAEQLITACPKDDFINPNNSMFKKQLQ